MKKLTYYLRICSILALFLAAAASWSYAETYTAYGFEYELRDDGSAEIIHYTGTDGTVVIPKELDGHPVMAVRTNPFLHYDEGGFYGVRDCVAVVEIDHPYLATIDGVLFGKSDLKLIQCPPSLSLQEYSIPNGIVSVGDYAFYGCKQIEHISIPESVQSIGNSAFCQCKSIKNVVVPESVSNFGNEVFFGCDNLSDVTLPSGLTRIPDRTFEFCKSLTNVHLQEGITYIGKWAFWYCTGLTNITIPSSVTTIEEGAFLECKNLISVVIPDSVTYIGERAFIYSSYSSIERKTYELPLPSLTLTVPQGSYAEAYCIENGLHFVNQNATYGDDNSWLPQGR